MEDIMLFALAVIAALPAAPASDASKLTLSTPTAIVELDTRKLKGEPLRLTWSPDAQQMYVQTAERDHAGAIKAAYHYVLALDGKAPARVDEEPAWSSAYWARKATQAAPGLAAFSIDVEERQKRVAGTATPMGGDLAKGSPEGTAAGVGAGTDQAMAAALQSQVAHYYTLKLKGEVIGEFVNTPAIPGLTFGWGPAGTGLIAFSNRDGHIVIMDNEGRKQEIASSKSALLPAWTDDGKRLAYLEKTGKGKAVLRIVDVTAPAQ
jgi:hypothetical protein